MKMTRPLSPSSLAEEPFYKLQKMGSNEVYVVLKPTGPAESDYYIYIVDLNEKNNSCSLVQNNPAFRLDNFPFYMALAILNSTLYMFGCKYDNKWQTASYSYRLSPQSDPCDINFKEDVVNSISPMKCEKSFPHAVLIGGRICVFSCYLYCNSSSFELYDPDTDKWSSLPEPLIDFTKLPKGKCEVKYFCVENLVFIISTVKGSYSIDLSKQRNDWQWVPCNLPPSFPGTLENPRPFSKDGDLVFTPFKVYDLADQHRLSLNFWCMKNQTLMSRDQSILFLPKGPEERLRVCIFEVGGPKYCDFDWPNDSILGFYVFEFGEDDTNKLSPTILNSRLFHLDPQIYTYQIYIVGVFPM